MTYLAQQTQNWQVNECNSARSGNWGTTSQPTAPVKRALKGSASWQTRRLLAILVTYECRKCQRHEKQALPPQFSFPHYITSPEGWSLLKHFSETRCGSRVL